MKPEPEKRQCKRQDCQAWKPIGDFGVDRSKPDGLNIYCRLCTHRKNVALRSDLAAKKKAEAAAKQLLLPTIENDGLIDQVREVLRKENHLSRRQIRRRVDAESDDAVGDALAVLWDANEARPRRNSRGEPIWYLRAA